MIGLLLAACAHVSDWPQSGRHDGEMCVATRSEPPNCGAVELTLYPGLVLVRVSDIVYRLFLRDGQIDLMLMHGNVQIDGFSTSYTWGAEELRFADPGKPVSYRIRRVNRS